jgi:hypothetical protein
MIPAARSDDSFGWIADPSVAAEHPLDGWTSLRGFNHDDDDHPPWVVLSHAVEAATSELGTSMPVH